MATAEILRVPVDDSQFTAFKESFDQYRQALSKMPADWQAINVRIFELAKIQRGLGVSSDKAWSNATKAATDYSRIVKQAGTAQAVLTSHVSATAAAADKLGQAARLLATRGLGEGTVRRMTAIGKASKMVAHDFAAVGKVVTRLARFSLMGVGGGLLGLGGLTFGLDRLADTVVRRESAARGLGVTPGQLASFNANFAPFVGPGVLQGAASAQVNAQQAGWLATLGLNPNLAANEPATVLAEQEMLALHRQLRGASNATLMNTAAAIAARHLGFSEEDIRRIHGTSARTLMLAGAETNRDAGALGFTAPTMKAWRDFSVQLHKAGILIETALINTLAPLAQPNALPALSKEIARFITDLGKSGEVKAAVADLAAGIKDFAKWIGSPGLRETLKEFAANAESVAAGLGNALRFLGLLPETPTEKLRKLSRDQSMESPDIAAARNSVIPGEAEGIRQAINSRVQRSSTADVMAYIRQASAKYGVDPAFAAKIARTESDLGQAKMLVSSTGAIGVFQLEPGTAGDLNVNPYRTRQNVEGGVKYLAQLKQHYHGNRQEIAAAYNWGFGNVDDRIKHYGSNWLEHVPEGVRRYVAENAGLPPGVSVALRTPPSIITSTPPAFPGGSFSTSTSSAPMFVRGAGPAPSGDILGDTLRHLRQQQAAPRALPPLARGTVPPTPPTHAAAGAALQHTAFNESDIAHVRDRFWHTSFTPAIRIENNTSSNAFVSANAAAA